MLRSQTHHRMQCVCVREVCAPATAVYVCVCLCTHAYTVQFQRKATAHERSWREPRAGRAVTRLPSGDPSRTGNATPHRSHARGQTRVETQPPASGVTNRAQRKGHSTRRPSHSSRPTMRQRERAAGGARGRPHALHIARHHPRHRHRPQAGHTAPTCHHLGERDGQSARAARHERLGTDDPTARKQSTARPLLAGQGSLAHCSGTRVPGTAAPQVFPEGAVLRMRCESSGIGRTARGKPSGAGRGDTSKYVPHTFARAAGCAVAACGCARARAAAHALLARSPPTRARTAETSAVPDDFSAAAVVAAAVVAPPSGRCSRVASGRVANERDAGESERSARPERRAAAAAARRCGATGPRAGRLSARSCCPLSSWKKLK